MKSIPHSRPTLVGEDAHALTAVLRSGQVAGGKHVALLEERFAKASGMREGVAVSSGTAALHLTLLALGIKQGDEVLIPAFTCSAVANAVRHAGAVPICVDVTEKDLAMDCEGAARKRGRKTKALIVVHPFGRAVDLKPFKSLNLPLIEDGTHAPLAKIHGRRVGSFGRAAVFSFYATKMLTTGEGGIIVTNDRAVSRTARDLRTYDRKFDSVLRYNYKMTDLQAALGVVQLKRLTGFIRIRRDIARRYAEAFQHLPVHLPVESSPGSHVYYRYIVRFESEALREQCRKAFLRKGIVCEPPVGQSLDQALKGPRCPVSRRLVAQTLSLPIYPSLTDADVQRVITSFRSMF